MISVMTEEALGQKIRRARRQLRWSQRRLASEVGVSLWTIGRWERGDTKPHYEGDIDALEAALGVSLDEPTAPDFTDPGERKLSELDSRWFTEADKNSLIAAYRARAMTRQTA